MLLAIDVGNTNTGFALFGPGGAMRAAWRCRTDSARTADEYAAWLAPLLSMGGFSFGDAKDIIVASVVPDANFNLSELGRLYFKAAPRFIDSQMVIEAGMPIRIDKPQEAGADRLVNAIAVKKRYGAPAIVIDFGTATTFDVLAPDGSFIGGVIAPGINLSCNALYQASAKLPKIDIKRPSRAIGANTVEAMQSGIYWGYVSLISGLLERCVAEIGGDKAPAVIATGGLARVFAPDMPFITQLDDDITTYGLYLLHETLTGAIRAA